LHIATHGYFITDLKSDTRIKRNEDAVFKISDHPMLRSGLILSGGNAGWKGERTFVGGEDGVLTAYAISQLNLFNTE